ncbi:MAG: hypothetical protein ACOWWR_15005 [Eubacteriales bacterium]
MRKKIIILIFVFIFMVTLSCSQNEEKINQNIESMTIKLIELDWKLHNLKISYEDYYNEAVDIFCDEETLNQHIENVLNPLIFEDVTTIDQSTVDKYKKINYKDYDMPSIKISKVYTNDMGKEKYIFIKAIISPFSIQNIYDTGVVFANMNYNVQEERNISIQFVKNDKNKWRIQTYEGNTYLLSLKENLSKEFISEYTTFRNQEVKYTKELKLVNP